MSIGSLAIIVLACMGGLAVVYGAGKNRHTSELVLEEYRRLLADARRVKQAPPLETPSSTRKTGKR